MRTWVLAICVLLATGCGTQQQDVRNPKARTASNRRAPKRKMVSPIGGYIVSSESPNRKSPERDLVITPNLSGEKPEILRFPFQRQVDVVWAPDERGVAIVDLVLMNESRVVVFDLPSGRPLFELRREMVCQLNPDLPCGDHYTHVFFSNVVWLAPDRIQVNVDMMNPLQLGLPREIHGNLVAQFPR